MTAALITVADAIVAELNAASAAGTFNRTFSATVLWAQRRIKLEETDVLRVDVAPIGYAKELVSRGSWSDTCRYDIGVRKRFVGSDQDSAGEIIDDEITELITLLDQLVGFFMPKQPSQDGRRLAAVPDAVWSPDREQTDVRITWDDLVQYRQFTGFFRLTYGFSD